MSIEHHFGPTSRRTFLQQTGILLGGAAFAGFASESALAQPRAQDAPAGTLTFGHFGDVDNYDPLTNALDLYQNYGRLLVFSALTAYDANLNLIGDLAESWELQDTSWVFKLRSGVTWHDGTPFTADDVKYTVEHILDPATGSFLTAQIGDGTTITVVDPQTIQITLTAVNASYPDQLTGVSIIKKDSGEANRDAPIGTGPFAFESWSPNEATVFVKNQTYFVSGTPLLESVIFRPVPEPTVAITNLTAGSLDAVSNQLVLPQTATELETREGISLIVVDPSTALAYANILFKEAPYTDKRFRQALAMCLDLDAVKELVYAGRGTPTNNFIPQLSWAYTEIPNYAFDPVAARALFAEAGVTDGFKTSILTIEGYPDLIAIAPIWQDGLKQAGIDASIETLEINAWIERWVAGEYEITLNFDINGPDPQRLFVADFLLHIAADEWNDPELVAKIQELSSAAIATADQEVRKGVYAELQTLLHDAVPMLPIYRPAIVGATSDKVTGFAIDGKGFYHFEQATIAE